MLDNAKHYGEVKLVKLQYKTYCWWFVTFLTFPYQLGLSSSQLTFIWVGWSYEMVDGYNMYNTSIWWFPQIVVPPNHPFLDGIVHYKPSSYGGTPIDGNPHRVLSSNVTTKSVQWWVQESLPAGRSGRWVPGFEKIRWNNWKKHGKIQQLPGNHRNI